MSTIRSSGDNQFRNMRVSIYVKGHVNPNGILDRLDDLHHSGVFSVRVPGSRLPPPPEGKKVKKS